MVTRAQPRWGGLYALVSLGLAVLGAVELAAEPGVLRTAVECGVLLILFGSMAWWVRASRAALDQVNGCDGTSLAVMARESTVPLPPLAGDCARPAGQRAACPGQALGVTLGAVSQTEARPARRGRDAPGLLQAGYLPAAAAVAAATAVSWPMFRVFDLTDIVMVYLLAIVVIAARYGRGPSVFAAVASVGAFDFFFVPPYLTLVVADSRHVLTFAVMLVVGLVISGLTARVRQQTEAARQREQWTAALYSMSREMAQAGTVADLVRIAAQHIEEVFDSDVAVLLAAPDGRLEADPGDGDPSARAAAATLSRWAFEHGRPAGLGTTLSPQAPALYVPLLGHRKPLGVVRLRPRRPALLTLSEPHRQIETFVNQTALALERACLADEAQDARVRAETERLRNALLTSVSHDLRTPLAAITGAATTMLEGDPRLDPRARHELLESVRDEADRLNRLVQNLLEMTRLEAGVLALHRDWHPLEEIVGAALGRLTRNLGARRVTVDLPRDLPLVAIDDVLIEQVLVNLLDNAVKYTPADSALRIVARAIEGTVTVEVADRGPGLPPGQEDRVFEKFYRGARNGRAGAGLGLAICRGIIQAHGGRIWAERLPQGGAAFRFTLPPTETPPAPVSADA